MKHLHTIYSFIILSSVILLGLSSCIECTDYDLHELDNTTWVGEFKTKTLNEATNEFEEVSGGISLTFYDDASRCSLCTSIEGLLSMNCIIYKVRTQSSKAFSLYYDDNGVILYSGSFSGDKMTFQALNCDSIAASYELTKIKEQ